MNHLKDYINGFATCIVITILAYYFAVSDSISDPWAVAIIAVLAVTQFVVQLVSFLHLGRETKPRWKQLVFWLMLTIVFILVAGSIWIMNSLNYRMIMSDEQTNEYIEDQSGF